MLKLIVGEGRSDRNRRVRRAEALIAAMQVAREHARVAAAEAVTAAAKSADAMEDAQIAIDVLDSCDRRLALAQQDLISAKLDRRYKGRHRPTLRVV